MTSLIDRIPDAATAERSAALRMLNRRIEVTDRYIERLRWRRDELIAERAGLIMQSELDGIRQLAGLDDDQISGDQVPVIHLDGEIFGSEDPERWDGLS